MKNKKAQIDNLVNKLNKARHMYYQESTEIMSNLEYDRLYDELLKLEHETGIVLSNSPTINVGSEVVSSLEKQEHSTRMLSLDKTKNIEELENFLGENEGILSLKLDGLTVVLTYENGNLEKAVTRGNGTVGEIVTNNAKQFINIPLKIPFKKTLIVRGEAVIGYRDFEKINDEISVEENKYKNPRNLCSGSVRLLDSNITKKRNVRFISFALVSVAGLIFKKRSEEFDFLESNGFEVVKRKKVSRENIRKNVEEYKKLVLTYDIPSDGLVLIFDDIDYSKSLGTTSKFPKDAIAYKWKDDTAKTILRDIKWNASRTGLINPIAIFDTVELEGTNVSRASLHNISIIEDFKLGIGDEIEVYKANMIIPQVAMNHTKSNNYIIPDKCPVCGKKTVVKNDNSSKTLWCLNEKCPIKRIKSFSLLVSRDALNIDGLSEKTIEKFIDMGFLKTLSDIFKLDRFKKEICDMEGFGEKSYNNIIDEINIKKHTELYKVIYGIGIKGIGLANSKLLCNHFNNNLEKLINASLDEYLKIDSIGDIYANILYDFFHTKKSEELINLITYLDIKTEKNSDNEKLKDKKFVVTGTMNIYNSRKDLIEHIESLGGSVLSSVSKNTNYLINNDINSTSSKNINAKKLNIPIITELEFIKMVDKDNENE